MTSHLQYTILNNLPESDPLRNTPLIEMGAQTRWMQSNSEADWKPCWASWKIARVPYNQLGKPWTEHSDWRVPAK